MTSSRICYMDDCELNVHARDVCKRHYDRITRTGSPEGLSDQGEHRRWTNDEKAAAIKLRQQGVTYKDIAAWLERSENGVKAFIKRRSIAWARGEDV